MRICLLSMNIENTNMLTLEERETLLRPFLAEHGEALTAERLGVPRTTLARLLAGLTVRKGTLLLARGGLASIRTEIEP